MSDHPAPPRRRASDAIDGPESSGPLTRRAVDHDMHALVCSVHHLGERVLVLETKMGVSDGRLRSIEDEIRGTKTEVGNVLGCLQGHIQNEEKQKNQVLMWVIATLLSVLGFGAAALINHLLSK
ncbi:MAG: hypothetical protein P9E24_01285 [Candidatus Competibacter sp.]|nr:hypothetical protein [Candidatus Competibacter sp.]MDG4583385.1 hypothetical protein [Candidatus Competibacter sp.]